MAHLLLEQARQARQRGAWDQALQQLEQALQVNPEDFLTCQELASTYAIRGRLNDSLRSYLRLADILRTLGDGNGALQILDLVVQLRPDHLEARQHRLDILEQRGMRDGAVQAYRELSRLLVELGQGERAIEWLERGQQRWPQALEIASELAEVLISQGHLEEGLGQFRRVAQAHLDAQQWEPACQAYRRMKLITPQDTGLLLELGQAHLRLKRFSEAEQEFRAVLRQDLSHREALRLLGKVCQQKGQWRDAALAFQRLLNLEPDDVQARLSLAEVMEAQEPGGCPPEPLPVQGTPAAASSGLKPRPVVPKLPTPRLTKPRLETVESSRSGLVAPQVEAPAKPLLRRPQGDSTEIPGWLLEGLEAEPVEPEGWFSLGEDSPGWLQGELVNAWQQCLHWPPPLTSVPSSPWPGRTFLAQSPSLPDLSSECTPEQRRSLQALEQQLSDLDLGARLAAAQQALLADPENPLIRAYASELLIELGLTEAAVEELRKAQGLRHRLFQALLWNQQPREALEVALDLAEEHGQRQQWSACRHWAQQALALEPAQARALELLAESESHEGYHHLRTAHLENLAWLMLQQGRVARAQELWLGLVDDSGLRGSLIKLGQALAEQAGCGEAVLEILSQEYERCQPPHSARLQLARAWLQRGHHQRCQQLLAQTADDPQAVLLGLELEVALHNGEAARERAHHLPSLPLPGEVIAEALQTYLQAWPSDLEVRLLRLEVLEQTNLDPEMLGAEWVVMARQALQQDEVEAAHRCLERATALGQGWAERARLELQLQSPSCLNSLWQWWQQQPGAESGQALVRQLVRQGQWEAAAEVALAEPLAGEVPADLDPSSQALLKARMLRKQGHLEGCLELLQQARKSRLHQVRAELELGHCWLARGGVHFEELALRQWQKALSSNQANQAEQLELSYQLGLLHLRRSEHEAALQAFHHCAALDSGYRDVIARIDELRQALNFA